jgi:hypothetical protein
MWPPDENAWVAKFYIGDARRLDGGGSFAEMQLWRMNVELRKAVRDVYLKDASERPVDYYL